MLNQFLIILPELMLTMLALLMQLVAAFYSSSRARKMIAATTTAFAAALIFFILHDSKIEGLEFHNSFAVNQVTKIFKVLVLGFTIMSMIAYQDFCKISADSPKIEFITLILLSTLGIFIAISSRNFLLLFCGLELQALCGYAMAAFNSSSSKSSEAGLKYFILGALLSCLSLFGISFIYGFGGSLQFSVILEMLNGPDNPTIGLVVGVALMLTGIFFKLSAAPLHMWTPDVYEGSPISAVVYFSTAQKIGTLAILFNIIWLIIGDYQQIAINLIRVVAILSMIIGALGAIRQQSLKRLMAYSTVLNIGYVLIGIALHSQEGNFAAGLYMLVYIVGVMGFFACLIALLGKKAEDATFNDICGIAASRKAIAVSISIIMFSMIGLPPLAGFFGKYYIFYQAIAQQEFTLAFVGIATSIIAAYYYLQVIKSMYFAENLSEIERIPTSQGLLFISCVCVGFILLFSVFPISYFQLFNFL